MPGISFFIISLKIFSVIFVNLLPLFTLPYVFTDQMAEQIVDASIKSVIKPTSLKLYFVVSLLDVQR